VPRALDEVVQHLLEKDPRDRYQSAAAVLADLDEIATGLERGVQEPAVAVGAHDRRRSLTEPAFVGRGEEMRAFEVQLSRALAGEPVLLLVGGESGAGKTRMLDQAGVAARQHGAWVLRGSSTERAPQRPLQVLDGIARAIVAAARQDPGLADALSARLGEHVETLCAALPRLAEILSPGAAASPGPEVHGEARTVDALIALVDALGAPSRPAVILLDDCQWLDDLSLKLLQRWHRVRGPERRAAAVVLVAAYRSEDVPAGSPLRRLAPVPTISLGPLEVDDVRRMAESMAGALPGEAVQLVQRLSEGNPFLVAAVLEGLVEGGALVHGARGWELEPEAMARAQSSRRWAVFLARRLDQVPPPALELLSVGAVLGKSFELKPAADLTGQSVTAAMASVAQARRRRLVWIDAQGSRCTFVHDRLREAVLERLPPAARRELHERAAAALEHDEPTRPDREFDLAYHFDSAGDHVRALPYALSAASRARAQYALEVAERYYRIAERGAEHDTVGADTRRQVAEALGDVLLLRGRYDESGVYLSRARALATSPTAQAAIDAKIGELAFKRGDVRAAADALERALPLLGRRVPRSPATMALSTLWLVLVQVAHTLLPRRLVARRDIEDGGADLLAARIFSRLAYANWFLRGQMATFWAHLSELNLAERYPPTRELAQAYSEHSISVTGLPRIFFRRGVRYAQRGLAIRRAIGHVWGQGQSLNFYGMLLYAFGRYEQALIRFREALRLLSRTGDRWEANIAGAHVALCLYRLGALREAVAECRRVHHECLEIGDRHAAAFVLEVWSKATGGAVPAEFVQAALHGSDGDAQTQESLLQAEGVRAIGAGRPLEAAVAFASAEEVARSAHLRSEYVSYIAIWLARARRLCAVQATIQTGVPVPERLHAAEATLRRGLRHARRHRGNLPMALRERALLRAMRGRALRGARRDLDASLAEAERQSARFEQAQTLLARGELGRLFGWPGAEAEAAAARGALHEMDADFACSPMQVLPPAEPVEPVTLSLADRFARIVDEGRRIASALTPGDVHAALCEAASVLLRGEATLVLTAGDGEPRMLAQRGGPAEFSRSLVERAMQEGGPVAFTEVLGEPVLESLVLPRPRSALCAPIVVGGRPAGCLYVTHALVSDLFREEEKQLAGYLVTLAGASLEKAESFAAVQDLSRTLLAANTELDDNLRRLREAQEEIVQAAKMATVGTLVAGLSHELANPLSVILGYAQSILKRMSDDDPTRPAILAMQRQARRCADLVRTLLDFSHKRPLELEDSTIDDLVQRVVGLASLKVRRHDATLEIDVPPPGTCRVRVSRTQIESALLNLVLNALDASPRGGVVRIEAAPREREGRSGVEVCVRDRGTGIAPEVLSRVFDPFFTTKPAGAGTGLGLSLSRRFVEGHEGHLAIESEVGEGTTVRVWLPA
jgi:signal transduction histidine kinase/tetratricopeptide (TPR) repeat protein